VEAEANVGGEDLKHILLKKNPSKAAILEEFLHGTPVAQSLPTSSNISKTPIRAFYIKKSSYTIHRCILSFEKTQSSEQSQTIIKTKVLILISNNKRQVLAHCYSIFVL